MSHVSVFTKIKNFEITSIVYRTKNKIFDEFFHFESDSDNGSYNIEIEIHNNNFQLIIDSIKNYLNDKIDSDDSLYVINSILRNIFTASIYNYYKGPLICFNTPLFILDKYFKTQCSDQYVVYGGIPDIQRFYNNHYVLSSFYDILKGCSKFYNFDINTNKYIVEFLHCKFPDVAIDNYTPDELVEHMLYILDFTNSHDYDDVLKSFKSFITFEKFMYILSSGWNDVHKELILKPQT